MDKKRTIDANEWWPVYSLIDDDKYGEIFDISDEELAWINNTFEEFDKVQKFLKEKSRQPKKV